jgi:hypothetical protein
VRPLILSVATVVALAPAVARADAEAPAPAGAVTVELASGSETLYPFTTHRFPAASPAEDDPINLIFEGAADPREVRAALLSVDGNRTDMPFAAFNCTWSDANGDEQAAWAAAEGWQGGVQLACGTYALRFHLRLFRQGARTLGGVHMDLQIPATTAHQVLSWELPRQMVWYDLIRSGLLGAAPYETAVFGPTPSHRAIPYIVFNGVPVGLRALAGLPLENQAQDVPIPCSGRAFVFDIQPSFAPEQTDLRGEETIVFNQVIPKPFCNSGADYVLVQGPVHFASRVQINPSGHYVRTELVSAALNVTPINPATGQPTGPTVPAIVFEDHRTMLTDNHLEVSWSSAQSIQGDAPQSFSMDFDAGQHDSFSVTVECGTPAP